jgi:hypothetical protein
MSDELVSFDETFEVDEGGGEFIVHPDGYECAFVCVEVKTVTEEGKEAIVLIGNCDGAKVQEHIGLRVSGNRTREIILWRLSAPLVSFGARKHGDKVTPADLLKCKGKKGPVRLKRESFESNKTGKTLWSNKVDRWLDPAKASSKPAAAAEIKAEFKAEDKAAKYDF